MKLKITKDITLGQLKDICLKHQTANKDCESCDIYRFCMYEISCGYPSGWKLEKDDVEER